ncbi:hypothetical protein N9Z41_02455 [bacterium]|nr:hypothetical protein [bacterium]
MNKPKMTQEEKLEYLDSISFSNLVRAIDEKWSHTYEDYIDEEFEQQHEIVENYFVTDTQ